MDADLSASVDVSMPSSFMARLELNQLLEEESSADKNSWAWRNYAIAASFAGALFVAGYFSSNLLSPHQHIAGEDYQALLAGVVEHMNEKPVTPVWDAVRANESANSHLVNYDGKLQLKYLENLQFSRICPMGEYRGLHASLETEDGVVTFAYIKGEVVDDMKNLAYEGYVTRVKPVRGGNLVIVSRTNKALEVADQQLTEAMYWEI